MEEWKNEKVKKSRKWEIFFLNEKWKKKKNSSKMKKIFSKKKKLDENRRKEKPKNTKKRERCTRLSLFLCNLFYWIYAFSFFHSLILLIFSFSFDLLFFFLIFWIFLIFFDIFHFVGGLFTFGQVKGDTGFARSRHQSFRVCKVNVATLKVAAKSKVAVEICAPTRTSVSFRPGGTWMDWWTEKNPNQKITHQKTWKKEKKETSKT